MCEFPLLLAYPLGGCADLSITSIELVSSTLVKLVYSVDVLVNDSYYDISNYIVTGTAATVKEVMPVYSTASIESPTASYTLLRLNPLLPGQSYTFGVTNLVSRYGTSVEADTLDIVAHSTKTDSALNILPSHFNKTPGSVVYSILSAITRSDEIIGGAFTSPMEVTTS